MSADNWTTCPRCTRRREEKLRASAIKVAEAYGKVPVEEWDAMRSAQSDAEAEGQEHTLREDYEFYGADEGEVVSSYSCSCTKCGLHLSFTNHHPIEGIDR